MRTLSSVIVWTSKPFPAQSQGWSGTHLGRDKWSGVNLPFLATHICILTKLVKWDLLSPLGNVLGHFLNIQPNFDSILSFLEPPVDTISASLLPHCFRSSSKFTSCFIPVFSVSRCLRFFSAHVGKLYGCRQLKSWSTQPVKFPLKIDRSSGEDVKWKLFKSTINKHGDWWSVGFTLNQLWLNYFTLKLIQHLCISAISQSMISIKI